MSCHRRFSFFYFSFTNFPSPTPLRFRSINPLLSSLLPGSSRVGEGPGNERLWQCNIHPGEVLCPAVLVKTRVCGGCSVSRAHRTSLRWILFRICESRRLGGREQLRRETVSLHATFKFFLISTDLTNRFNISSSSSSSTFYQWNPCSTWTAPGHPCEDAAVSRTLPSRRACKKSPSHHHDATAVETSFKKWICAVLNFIAILRLVQFVKCQRIFQELNS